MNPKIDLPSELSEEPSAATSWEPLGRVLEHALDGRADAVATVLVSDGTVESLSGEDLLRTDGFPDPETLALEFARGRVLDLGAGAGSHTLALQARGLDVLAVDLCPEAVSVMERRGVRAARCATAETLLAEGPPNPPFDTLLLMMNGLGLAGTLDQLTPFLQRCHQLLAADGQLLADLTDPFVHQDSPTASDPRPYPGEVEFQLLYDGLLGTPFPWLFLDPHTLRRHAHRAGFATQIAFEDEHGHLLVRLTPE